MSSHPCSLGKLAQRGASLQISPLATTMRSFHHSRSRPTVVPIMGQLSMGQRIKPDDNGRVRKIVGVKKSLVNQMQGMAPSLGPSKVASPYKTRLFSSSSSLHSRSLQQQQQEEDEEEYSDPESLPPNTTASLSATQRGYNRAEGFGKGMAMQAARDISRSIQEELMVVDADTRHMLNCGPSRQALRNYHEQMAHRAKAPGDPMTGWKHPRPLKHLATAAVSSAGEGSSSSSSYTGGSVTQPEVAQPMDRQVRPRRRQMVIAHAGRNREHLAQLPPLNAPPKFELYASNAREKFSEQRTELRPPTSWHSPKEAVEQKPEDLLMDVALARAVRPDITVARGVQRSGEESATESDSWYEQPAAERELLKQAILGGGRSRLDALHYEAADNAAQISASQQVINQKYAGFRRTARGNQKQMIRQIVEPVNPTPQLKPSARAMSEPRDSRKRWGSVRQGTGRQATPKFFANEGEPRNAGEDEDGSSWPPPHNTQFQMATRSETRLESEQEGRGRNEMGEKRGAQKTVANEAPVEHNDIGMPEGYKRESAVQRLGSTQHSKHSSRALNSY
ncbi:uncharacterized protein LOC128260468 [Drosophila gunungcola]|uniref:uncharacterized protein LOC128260468 n=1 Tax=Drosophila gunungcola TaxID=103775 RepID=UPI0022E71F66|nr:uncharacterized protein LOC128260468 [Drosophila gunungcola]